MIRGEGTTTKGEDVVSDGQRIDGQGCSGGSNNYLNCVVLLFDKSEGNSVLEIRF